MSHEEFDPVIEMTIKPLANCPFCGSAKVIIMAVWRGPSLNEGINEYFPHCQRCGAFIQVMPMVMSFPSGFRTEEEARAFFNCRSDKRDDEDEFGNTPSDLDPCDSCDHWDICDWWELCAFAKDCEECHEDILNFTGADVYQFCEKNCGWKKEREKRNENT